MRSVGLRLSLPGLVGLFLCGCGSGDGYQLGRVSGTVTHKGQPVQSGFITFLPDDSKQTVGPSAMSKIAADGSYAMSSKEANDGAVVGFHKVGIMAIDLQPIVQAPEKDETPKDIMITKGQARRRPPQKKSLGPTFTDRAGNVYRILTPEDLRSPDTSGVSVEVRGGTNTLNFSVQEDGKVVVEKR
jgi:hypothetical protein